MNKNLMENLRILKDKIISFLSEKIIYEVFTLIYVALLYITLFKSIDVGFKLIYIIAFAPMAFLVLISMIITPILLGKEPTQLRNHLDKFYAFTSFWLLINIITFIFILRVI